MTDHKDPLYRVTFQQNDKTYQLISRYLTEETLIGFIEVEELVFSDDSGLVIDPSEEKLKLEFKHVKRCYIPMHTVLRIDEIKGDATAKISESDTKSTTNVHPFPSQLTQKD